MIRRALFLAMLPALVFAESANDPAATAFRSTVAEVRVTFFATDDHNQLVNNVRPDDFAIVDGDMVVRDFRSLAPARETTLEVLVAVDASESVAPEFRAAMNNVVQLLSQKEIASDEHTSVLLFAGVRPTLLCAGNCRSSETAKQLLTVKAEGATPLFDALSFSADFIARRVTPEVRPVLILFSDGDDTISRTSARDALQALIASGALLYAVDMSSLAYGSHRSTTLEKMAEATGGRYFSMREAATDVLHAALQDLRFSYVVTYPLPSAAVGFHSLRILPKHNLNLQFHCRNGYYYGGSIQ